MGQFQCNSLTLCLDDGSAAPVRHAILPGMADLDKMIRDIVIPRQQVSEKMREARELVLAELRRRGMTDEEIQAFLSYKRNPRRKPRD